MQNNDVQTVGSRIKQRRKELGLTLLDIAKYVGVTEATVQRWESGNIKNVRHEKVALLSQILQTSPAVIMGWEQDQNDNENGGETMQPNNDVQTIGSKIKELRMQKGMTLQEPADKVYLNKSTLKRYEDGEIIAKRKILEALAKELGVSIQYLLNEEENGGETMSNENNSTEKYTAADKKKILDALKLIRQECIDAEECKRCAFWVSRGCRFKLERNPSDWELIDDECAWRAFREPTRRPEGACFLNKD